MNFCIYSGTFNPIHTAHLIIAQTVKEETGSDRIVLIPAHVPPHRNENLAAPHHRMNMLKLAIADNPDFTVSDIEYQSNEKSYTYHTICKIKHMHSSIKGKIDFIIGTDAFLHIDSWYEAEKLADLVRFIIVPRTENLDTVDLMSKIKLKNIDYQVVNVPFMDISSSYIRKRIEHGKSIKYIVPKAVEDYIYDNDLFKSQY